MNSFLFRIWILRLYLQVDVANGKTYSFSQLKEYAIKIASGLRKLGYKKGDVIAVHATNCAEYAILLLAIPAAGLTITTTNPAFTSGEDGIICPLCTYNYIF